MGRWLVAFGLILIIALGALSYVRQPAPRSALGDVVGVRRNRPFNHFCGWFVRDTRFGTYATGEAVCAWYRPDSPERRAELDQLKYHVLTRRVRHAVRSWEPLSEEAWQRDVDSVRTALRAQGGVHSCVEQTRHAPAAVLEYWRFSNFHVLLFSSRDTLPTPGFAPDGPRWFLFLRGAPGRSLCEGPPRRLSNDALNPSSAGVEASGFSLVSPRVPWRLSSAPRYYRLQLNAGR